MDVSKLDVDNLFRSLDITATRKREMIMTNAKAQAKEPKRKTVGTVMAEKLRAEANGISNSEREELLKEGLAMTQDRTGCQRCALPVDCFSLENRQHFLLKRKSVFPLSRNGRGIKLLA